MITTEEITKIIEENKRRYKSYFRTYNPIIGDKEGEVVPRTEFKFDGKKYYIPTFMLEEDFIKVINKNKGDIHKLISDLQLPDNPKTAKRLRNKFFNLRLKHDFEFFAYLELKIQDKETKRLIPFALNPGQRILLKEFEAQRVAGMPIRVILVKARQWGGSTLTQLYMLWLQLYHYDNWHSAIIAKVNAQAANIRGMLGKAVKSLPAFHEQISIKPFEGQQNIKFIPQRGCVICVTSAEEPDALRSFDFSMIHMSEVGLWKATPSKSPDDVAQTVYATVPDKPGTFICIESTAKGVGGFFYENYRHAVDNKLNKREGLQPVFVAWYNIELYTKEIKDYKAFIEGMSAESWLQWKEGATLEGINWYTIYKSSKKYTDFQMKSEFPTTAEEAFQSQSGKYFMDEMLEHLKSGVCEPAFIGDIRGDGLVGEKAMSNITLVSNSGLLTEVLKIWIDPDYGINPAVEKVSNRFVVTVDIGGTHYKSDNSVISVFDRFALMEPHGAVERAAIWFGHVDHDILAWKAVQIAKYYHNALLVIESNTIDSRDKKNDANYVASGDHTYTVLNKIEESGYTNLYYRKAPPEVPGGPPVRKIGWHMNKQTKYLAYDTYFEKVRQKEYIEHSMEAYTEAAQLEIKESGAIEAMKSARDDMQDTTATGVHICYDFGTIPIPKIINISANEKNRIKKNKGGVSSF